MGEKTISIYQLFPFEKVGPGEEIILYGLGKIGKRYLAQVEETGYCKIKYVIDRNASEYKDFRIPVRTIDYLDADEEAPVVVSVYSKTKRKEIVEELENHGISKEKIIIGDHRVVVEEGKDAGDLELFHEADYTDADAQNRFGTEFLNFCKSIEKELKIKSVENKALVRIGKEDDGGYIMVDDFKDAGIAYSFGISDDVSWDADMSDRGYEVFMYDHTIEKLPYETRGFHFFKKGIADSLESSDELNSLEYYLEENGHLDCSGMILKMDVEGAERGFFNLVDSDTLKKFDQIVFELHGLLTEKYSQSILDAIKKINKTHELFHIHGNNHGNVIWINDKAFPELLELSFVKKDLYETQEVKNVYLPLEIDKACLKEYPDIPLGDWNARQKEKLS